MNDSIIESYLYIYCKSNILDLLRSSLFDKNKMASHVIGKKPLTKPSMQMTLIKILDRNSQRQLQIDGAEKLIEEIAAAVKCNAEIIQPCFDNEFVIK